jgi:hypothetical protein
LIISLFLLLQAVVAWRETMGMFEFQSRRDFTEQEPDEQVPRNSDLEKDATPHESAASAPTRESRH